MISYYAVKIKKINEVKSALMKGFVIRMFGNIIYWKAQKQKTVTKNSTFAEDIAGLKRQQKYYL